MKEWTQVPAGDINAANQRLWVAVGDNADEVAAREPSTSQKLAREIMGKNFFGIEEAIKHFGVNATKQQLAALAEIPFSEEVLKSCKDTHVLVAVFPLSILDICDITRKLENQTLFYKQARYNKKAFAKDKGEVGWQLVRKEPIADSTSKTWNEQLELLSKDEGTPTVQIVVYTMIGHFLNTGERLFEKIYVLTSSLGLVDLVVCDSPFDYIGLRVYVPCVGGFDSGGLRVYISWSDVRNVDVGLSATRNQ